MQSARIVNSLNTLSTRDAFSGEKHKLGDSSTIRISTQCQLPSYIQEYASERINKANAKVNELVAETNAQAAEIKILKTRISNIRRALKSEGEMIHRYITNGEDRIIDVLED